MQELRAAGDCADHVGAGYGAVHRLRDGAPEQSRAQQCAAPAIKLASLQAAGAQDRLAPADARLCPADPRLSPSVFYCSADSVARVCDPNPDACAAVVKRHCKHLAPDCPNNQTQCQMCQNCAYGVRQGNDTVIGANCSDWAMRSACGEKAQQGEPARPPPSPEPMS